MPNIIWLEENNVWKINKGNGTAQNDGKALKSTNK